MYYTKFTSTYPSAPAIVNVKSVNVKATDLLVYENKTYFASLCEKCPDYLTNWSCPPASPAYSIYTDKFPHVLLAAFYCKLDCFPKTNGRQAQTKTANTVLRQLIEKSLRSLEKIHQGLMLSSGICRLCSSCTRTEGTSLACMRPKEMRYSLESLGLDVVKISEELLDHKILWAGEKEPAYVSAVAGLMTHTPVEASEISFVL